MEIAELKTKATLYDPLDKRGPLCHPFWFRCFGLGQLDGELVAFGGVKKRYDQLTKGYTYMMSDYKNGNKCRFLPFQWLEAPQ